MAVINFGSLNIDYVYQVEHFVQPGETLSSQNLQVNCGGKGLNQSIALAKAGVPTFHGGNIHPGGRFLREKLEEWGVDTRFVKETATQTGHAIIQVDAKGENSILLFPGANHCLTPDFIDQVLAEFTPKDMVLLQNETNCVEEIIRKGAAKGMSVVLNAAPAGENLLSMPLELLSWLLINETEGAFLSGETEPERILSVLAGRYPHTGIVLTLGADGCAAVKEGEILRVPAVPTQVVDTTAAGDTFTGYFLRGILDGKPLADCLRLASAASALAVSRQGAADSVPSYEEALERYQSQWEQVSDIH